MTTLSTLNDLRGAVRLSFAGTVHVLTEYHDVSQPEADILALTAILNEIDAIADLPTLSLSDTIIAIRASVENTYNTGAKPEKVAPVPEALEEDVESARLSPLPWKPCAWVPRGTPT